MHPLLAEREKLVSVERYEGIRVPILCDKLNLKRLARMTFHDRPDLAAGQVALRDIGRERHDIEQANVVGHPSPSFKG
jgi:hypothetical protein